VKDGGLRPKSGRLLAPLALTQAVIQRDTNRSQVYVIGMSYLYLLIAIVSEVTATSFLKASGGFTKLTPSLVTAAGYAAAFYFLSLTLREVPTGIAYAIWSGVGIVLIAAVAWLFQGQKLDAPAIIGMALIIAGVMVLNIFSKVGTH
jgi:small multidrug resistance pump